MNFRRCEKCEEMTSGGDNKCFHCGFSGSATEAGVRERIQLLANDAEETAIMNAAAEKLEKLTDLTRRLLLNGRPNCGTGTGWDRWKTMEKEAKEMGVNV